MVAPIGRLLVPQTWRSIRLAFEKTTRAIRDKVIHSSKVTQAQVQPAYVRNVVSRQPIHRVAAVRQSQSRWYSTRRALDSTIRRFTTIQQGVKAPRSAYPSSRTATAVSQLTSRAPFASTLRPNLTGGTLSRTAGGYANGAGRVGGARYFSHSPAAPAQVVNNVSAAMRAFWLSGQRIQYDGSDHRTGAMNYKAVKRAQHETGLKMHNVPSQTPGSYVDFKISPMVTAIGALGNTADSSNTLNQDGLLENLSGDFARAFKDLSIITNDLKKLASVGDLALLHPEVNILRVRFPGVDAETIERLCDELGIQRGIVHEDPEFDAFHGAEMALLFPFAPSRAPSETTMSERPHRTSKGYEDLTWQEMLSPKQLSSPGFSHVSATSQDYDQVEANPWLSSPSGYSSLGDSENDAAYLFEPVQTKSSHANSRPAQSHHDDFEGLEGIYRFLEECDRARR